MSNVRTSNAAQHVCRAALPIDVITFHYSGSKDLMNSMEYKCSVVLVKTWKTDFMDCQQLTCYHQSDWDPKIIQGKPEMSHLL